jgi:pimeloyl-ACP methyl ester carboxylesterase
VIRIERSAQHGPTVVLLHELGGSAATFRWLTPYLTDCRTLLVNLPGTAGSISAPEESSLGDLASCFSTDDAHQNRPSASVCRSVATRVIGIDARSNYGCRATGR